MTTVAVPLILIILIGVTARKVDNRTRALLLAAALVAAVLAYRY
jgi:hypothetical protein